MAFSKWNFGGVFCWHYPLAFIAIDVTDAPHDGMFCGFGILSETTISPSHTNIRWIKAVAQFARSLNQGDIFTDRVAFLP